MKTLHLLPTVRSLGFCVAVAIPFAFLSGCSKEATSLPTPAVSVPTVTTANGGITPVPLTGGLRVACVGDSITTGAGTTYWKTDSYPALIGHWLGKKYQVQGFGAGGTTLINHGNTPYQKTAAYARALIFKPEILIVALGTNDQYVDYDAATKAQLQSDYKALIAAFKAANPRVKTYVCIPPPCYKSPKEYSSRVSAEIAPLVKSVARSEGLTAIDFNALLTNHPELFKDGIHPNNEGTRLMAVEVYRALTGHQPPA